MIEIPLKILLVEDATEDAFILKRMLSKELSPKPIIENVFTISDAIEHLSTRKIDIIFLDLSLADSQGLDGFRTLYDKFVNIPIIISSGNEDTSTAVEAVQEGAQDYLLKGRFDAESLARSVRYAIERHKISKQMIEAQRIARMGSWELDLAAGIVQGSHEFFELMGIKSTNDSISLNELIEHFDDDSRKLLNEMFSHKIIAEEGVHLDLSFLHADAGPKYVVLRAESLLNHDGAVVGMMGTLLDITERKQIEQMKDELIGIVSHELRSPITIIYSAINNLLDGVVGELSSHQKEVLSIAKGNTKRLDRIIGDLLDVSRLESGKISMNLENKSLNEFIVYVSANLQSMPNEITIEFMECDNLYAMIDSDRLLQVMTNLIGNAARYAKNKINISCEEFFDDSKQMIRIGIHDDGEGIAKEHHNKLFQKFSQINRKKGPGYQGTGLGLAICKKIVEQHGGRIWVESSIGEGAHFYFTLQRSE